MKSLLQQLFKVLFLHHNFTKMHIILWNIYPDEVTLSRTQSLYGEIRQNRHSRRILRIRQNRQFVGTSISSSIALWRNSSKSPCSPNSPDSSKLPLRQYPYLELNRSSPDSSKSPLRRYPYLELNPRKNFVKIAILAKFAGFVKIAALSVPLSRAQSHYGKNLEPNRSMPKFVKIAILTEFTGFVKIAASSVPLSRAQLLFGEISSNRHSHRIRRIRQNRRFVGTPISSSIALCQIRQNRRFVGTPISSSIALCKIRQNRRFNGTPISSSIALRRNFVKITILTEFAGFIKIATLSVPLS